MPKTELTPDLERRIASARGQLERLEREAQPWQAVRDQLISEAKRTGASARTIASAAGVSHTYVAQLPADLPKSSQAQAAGSQSSQAAPLLVVDEDTSEADVQRALDSLQTADLCGCAEPNYAIIGATCRHCDHSSDLHDQKGCHAS